MKILDLSLTYHWYDEIEAGRKKEEYREWKDFYNKRFMDGHSKTFYNEKNCEDCFLYGVCDPIQYDAVRFHRGQGSKTTMLIKWKGLSFDFGNPNWGAPTDHKVWIIKLGDKILKQ